MKTIWKLVSNDRAWFVFYGIVFLAQGGWLLLEERRDFQGELTPYFSRVLKTTTTGISSVDQSKFAEIRRAAGQYASPINIEMDRLAGKSLAKLAGLPNWFYDPNSFECAEPHRMTLLVDSLFTFMEGHTAFHFEVPSIAKEQASPAKWSPEVWSQFRPDEQNLLASALTLQASLEVGRFLDSCRTNVEVKELVFDRFYPRLHRTKSAVLPGERFDGGIFLMAYTATADSMKIWVNGKSLPVKDGIARFSNRYSRPGIYRLATSIAVSNVQYGKMNMYERDFEVEVLPNCIRQSPFKKK